MLNRKGFTLPQLIVVLLVTILITALLFPAMDRVRENAERVALYSDIKDLLTQVEPRDRTYNYADVLEKLGYSRDYDKREVPLEMLQKLHRELTLQSKCKKKETKVMNQYPTDEEAEQNNDPGSDSTDGDFLDDEDDDSSKIQEESPIRLRYMWSK